MTREGLVFEQLKQGKKWEDVISEGGKSSAYNGLKRYEVWVAPRVNELQSTISSLEAQCIAIKAKGAALEADYKTKESKANALDSTMVELEQKKTLITSNITALEAKRSKLQEAETSLNKRGITIELMESIAATDANNPRELLKRVRTAADSSAEEKKLAEVRQAAQTVLSQKSDLDKKCEKILRDMASWETRRGEVKEQAKLYEESNLIVQNAFARGYGPDILKMLFNLLQRFEVKGMPDASVRRLIKGFDGVKELSELDFKKARLKAEVEAVNGDLATVEGKFAAAVNTVMPTLNNTVDKANAAITSIQETYTLNMSTLSQRQQGELTLLEKNAEANISTLKDAAIKQQREAITMLNQMMLNLSVAFGQYSKDIQQWGSMKAETGKFEAELKWGHYIQSLVSDPKLAADMSTSLALHFATWLNIWVGRRLPEAKSLPPEHLSKQESGLSRYFPVKIVSVTGWVRQELADLQRRGVI